MQKTHYDNLQVTQNASPEVIRGAYRYLSQKWHPDKNPDNREETERFSKIINQAYMVLSDPQLRKEHDEWIESQREPQPKPGSKPAPESSRANTPPTQARRDSATKPSGLRQEAERRRQEAIDANLQDLNLQATGLESLRIKTRYVRAWGFICGFLFTVLAVSVYLFFTGQVTKEILATFAFLGFLAGIAMGLVGVLVAPEFSKDHRLLTQHENRIAKERSLLEAEKLTLPFVYWGYGVLGGLACAAILAIAKNWDRQPYMYLFFACLYYQGWVLIQTWKASTRYTGPIIWAFLAKTAAVFGASIWFFFAIYAASLVFSGNK